jgi:hypothetical protein
MNPLAGPAGPGKYSTRTDNLQMGSIAYGEGVETAAIKSGAPLSRTPDVQARQISPAVPLTAPTERPTEPITAGMDMGAGPGSEVLPNFRQQEADIVKKYMPSLELMAQDPQSPQAFRIFVRYLQGNM